MYYLFNQKGAALPLALVIVFVLLLFGTALAQYSNTDAIHVAHNEKSMKAYYIARSAADALAAHIINDSNELDKLVEATKVKEGTGALGEGTFYVSVTNHNGIEIQAKGTVGDVTKNVILSVVPRNLFDSTIYGHDSVNVGAGAFVEGDVVSGGLITVGNNATIKGETDSYASTEFPAVNFPTSTEDLIHYDNQVKLLDKKEPLIFNTGNSGEQLKVLMDKELIVNNGKIEVTGDGVLLLYLKEGASIFGEVSGKPNQIFLFCAPNKEITLQTGKNIFNGYIYAPDATVTYKSGIFTGAIIAGKVNISANGDVYYAGGGIAPDNINLPSVGYIRGSWSK
ncbi:hypothetical protein F9B85_11485 [Heliorestis acidaminivorans]|uniref:DUF7305 domain-containing protein n=1 Tax=Heliorestis acidaminivorans TaxID=553427 RepID=A0A6I0F0N5_9FIRM|nr:hypothetical protein [Heliorestis acidaminivorans]KAB2951649.1 hypothetical protein F9B85_11485 [Heliorestis acidaminivorans]